MTCAFPCVPETPQPGIGPMSLTQPTQPTKKGRKPKLQRQNAVMDTNQNQEQPRLESLPADFFNDLDLSALASN